MCETCKHWERLAEGYYIAFDAPQPVRIEDMGTCFCGPPSADKYGFGIWPITERTARCGQWESK